MREQPVVAAAYEVPLLPSRGAEWELLDGRHSEAIEGIL
jgi:hypothetical protein